MPAKASFTVAIEFLVAVIRASMAVLKPAGLVLRRDAVTNLVPGGPAPRRHNRDAVSLHFCSSDQAIGDIAREYGSTRRPGFISSNCDTFVLAMPALCGGAAGDVLVIGMGGPTTALCLPRACGPYRFGQRERLAQDS